jgi:hypothetical protein
MRTFSLLLTLMLGSALTSSAAWAQDEDYSRFESSEEEMEGAEAPAEEADQSSGNGNDDWRKSESDDDEG